jgi:hypothetical protein
MANYEFRPEDFTNTRFQDVITAGVSGLEKGASLADTLMSAPIKRATNALQLETLKREFQSSYLSPEAAKERATLQMRGMVKGDGSPLYTEEEINNSVNRMIGNNVISVKDLDKLIEDLKTAKSGMLKVAPTSEREALFSLYDQFNQLKNATWYYRPGLVGTLNTVIDTARMGSGSSFVADLFKVGGNIATIVRQKNLSPEDARFWAALASFQNRYVKDTSGATVTDGEAFRVFSALVNTGLKPENFVAVLKQEMESLVNKTDFRYNQDIMTYLPQSVPTPPADLKTFNIDTELGSKNTKTKDILWGPDKLLKGNSPGAYPTLKADRDGIWQVVKVGNGDPTLEFVRGLKAPPEGGRDRAADSMKMIEELKKMVK